MDTRENSLSISGMGSPTITTNLMNLNEPVIGTRLRKKMFEFIILVEIYWFLKKYFKIISNFYLCIVTCLKCSTKEGFNRVGETESKLNILFIMFHSLLMVTLYLQHWRQLLFLCTQVRIQTKK